MVEKAKSSKTSIVFRLIIWIAILYLGYLPFSSSQNSSTNKYPSKPIELVVPFKAGGGTDVVVRMFQKAINKNKLLPVPLVVVNRPGAGGSDGSRYVKDLEPDGYTILNLHDAMIISKYFGNVEYGPEAFDLIAGTVTSGLVIVVKDKSPYKNLNELIEDSRKKPNQLIFGCALGTPTHVSGLLLENAAKVDFNLIQSGGGAARLEQLMGGHIDVSVFSVAEFMNFKSQGLRALAYMSAERHVDLPDLPTAIEQNVNVINDIMFYWWFPKGTDSEKVKYMAKVFKEALKDEELKSFINKLKMSPEYVDAEKLDTKVKMIESKIKGLNSGDVTKLPPFHLLTGALVIFFLLFIIRDNLAHENPIDFKPEPVLIKPAIVTAVLTILYVALMSFGILDFRILTLIFMMALGLYLCDDKEVSKLVLLECSLFISLGTYYVFTDIVYVDLP